MADKRPILKPSGYDVVIKNRNAIRRINARFKKASGAQTKKLVDEKDRLLHEMWKACPHEEVAHCSGTKTSLSPDPVPMRICTGCGESELALSGTFDVLKRGRGRTLKRFDAQAYSIKMGQILIATGINIKNG